MERNNFERESEIIGFDFSTELDMFGGKVAGLSLARDLIQNLNLHDVLIVPSYTPVETTFYGQFEKVVEGLGGAEFLESARHWLDVDSYRRVIDPDLPDSMGLLNRLNPVVRRVLEHFQTWGEVHTEDPFHIRISGTEEDFRDDRFWGVFATHQAIPFFRGFGGEIQDAKFAIEAIVSLFVKFYLNKHSKWSVGLPDDAAAGLVIQKTVNSVDSHGFGITAYSSYPEPEYANGPAVLEVHQVPCGYPVNDELGMAPMTWGELRYQLSFISDNSHETVLGYCLDGKRRIDDWADEERVRNGFLNDYQRATLHRILQLFEKALGYPVNLELWTEKPDDRMFNLVQLRPTPMLSEDRPVKRLEPLEVDEILLCETPFVFGSFKHKVPLVWPTRRSGYTTSHKFEKPVAICCGHGRDMFEFAEMPNVLATLNLKEGLALAHNCEFRPDFHERESFHYVGAPMLRWIEAHFGEVQDFGGEYGLRTTPFAVTIEADGRQGRVSMSKVDAEKFGVSPP